QELDVVVAVAAAGILPTDRRRGTGGAETVERAEVLKQAAAGRDVEQEAEWRAPGDGHPSALATLQRRTQADQVNVVLRPADLAGDVDRAGQEDDVVAASHAGCQSLVKPIERRLCSARAGGDTGRRGLLDEEVLSGERRDEAARTKRRDAERGDAVRIVGESAHSCRPLSVPAGVSPALTPVGTR